MFTKKDNNYFEMLIDLSHYCCETAKDLENILNNFDVNTLEEAKKHIHSIEHAADLAKHKLMRKLVKEFITPIEREDIIKLTEEIDDVTDSVEDIILRIHMFNIQSIRPDALEFAAIITRCCYALEQALKEFPHFRKSKTIHQHIVEINRLEEEGDRMYSKAVRNLYKSSNNPIEILSWTDVFHHMELACDACEHAADTIESVMMKNN
ncbi:MAG: DUF47 family protein [Clostridia bacterium]|jgi:hypothetical protein|nr:DUF47 family protein [Clostridia bacterium]